jgi:protein TonB
MSSAALTVELMREPIVATSRDADVDEGNSPSLNFGFPATDHAPPAQEQWPILITFSGALSLLAHISILIWLLVEPPSQPGLAGQELEAIGVEIVDASALESISSQRTAAQAVATSSIAAEAGIETPITQPEVAPASPEPERFEVAQPPPALLVAQSDLAAEITTADVAREKLEERPRDEPARDHDREPKPAAEPVIEQTHEAPVQVAQLGAIAGGATASGGDASAAAAAGVASASPGQLALFAMQVRGAIGRSRPRHLGARGRVVVAFVLTDAGVLESAKIAKSSTNPSLDESALRAVQATPFPRPPVGASEAQRSFVVPFDFK